MYLLRAVQLGISLHDLDLIRVGDVFDMLTESANDSAQYDYIATQEDIDRL